ncbi:MAG: metal-binding protein [Deinococcota bacterium]
MPNGRQHETINIVSFVALGSGYALARSQGLLETRPLLTSMSLLTSFSVSYTLGTFLVTPDLDLAENRVRAKGHWGMLGWLWVPYGKLFSHRGRSHTWFVGPFTRLAYLAILGVFGLTCAALIASALGRGLRLQTQVSRYWFEISLGIIFGYYISQWVHLLADGVFPWHGHSLRRRRSRKRKSRKRRQRARW